MYNYTICVLLQIRIVWNVASYFLTKGSPVFCFPGCNSFGNIVNILTPYYCTNQSNIVGLDAFSLNWQLQLCPYHIVRLVPVEYLQLWKGVFAGITLLESNALLLRMKVGGQGTLLRTCCYAVLSHSHPHPHPPLLIIGSFLRNGKYNGISSVLYFTVEGR